MNQLADQVAQVNLYPIKSCHAATVNGEIPDRLNVGLTGFEAHGVHDREFILYDPNEGSMVTQRGWAADSQKPKFKNDSVLAAAQVDVAEGYMTVAVPGFGTCEIPTEVRDNVSQTIQIFGNDLAVIEQGRGPASFFSRVLGRDVLLVRADHARQRLLPEEYRREGACNITAGADGMPFLLTSQASLDYQHLKNGLEPGTVPINRYRGNIVMAGHAVGAFLEDRIRRLRIGDMSAAVVKACARCPIPNIDQETGERGGSGGLAVLRGRAGVSEQGAKGVFFGQNLNHDWRPGLSVGVGDVIEVLQLADKPNVELRTA